MDDRVSPIKAEAVMKKISGYLDFYQSQGLKKEKALELALKSVGLDCEITTEDMAPANEQSASTKIVAELYRTLEHLGAKSDLLGTVGSFRDTLSDDEVLGFLRDWNQAQMSQ